MKKFLEYWSKYNIIIFIIVLIWALYLTFSPKDIKIIKTEYTRIVENKTEINRLKSELNKLEKQFNETKKNINITETIKEIRHTDGKIEIITERTIIDKSELKQENSMTSSNMSTVDTIITTNREEQKELKETTIINKYKLWITGFGYNYFNKQIELSQGVNINNLTLMLSGLYEINTNRFDIGGKILIKY